MNTSTELNYLELDLRFSTSADLNYFKEDSSAGIQVESVPRNRVRYYDKYLITFIAIPAAKVEEEPSYPKELLDPLAKYKTLIHKIDFSEIGTEREKMEEEMRIYFDLVDYRKRATTVFIDGKPSETQKCN